MLTGITPLYEAGSGWLTIVVTDPAERECALIDCVLGVDSATGATDERTLAPVIALVRREGLHVHWLLDTHVHADHVSGARALHARLGDTTCIGAGIVDVRRRLADAGDVQVSAAGTIPYDRLLQEGESLALGDSEIRVLNTPGHTPSCVSYLIDDCVFVGDTIFMPQGGTARCDFPGGDARVLYATIRELLALLALPPNHRLFTAHDYGPDRGESPSWESTVADQRARNIHVRDGVGADAFFALRAERDRTLAPPRLYRLAVQANAFG